jgi:hypothetical protein
VDDLFYVEDLSREEQKKVKTRKKSAKTATPSSLPLEATPSNDTSSETQQRKKLCKNSTVDASFLPDHEREDAERREREQLQEWLKRQEETKKEIEITLSYSYGSGHRRSVVVSRSFYFCF